MFLIKDYKWLTKKRKDVNMKKMLKKIAFTLAETLITLGIIGIVAAMTIPTLLKKLSNDRDSAILKEDYSILQQMMKSANEEGAMANIQNPNDLDEMTNWFKTYFLPFIKTTNVCYDEWGCWSKDVKESNGRKFTNSNACGFRSISFVLNNGSYVCMDDFSGSRFGVILNGVSIGLMVDVNGNKKPNTIGKDIFTLVFKDEQLLPGGYDMTKEEIEESCSPRCNLGNYRCGSYCMVKAKNQGFKLPVMSDK